MKAINIYKGWGRKALLPFYLFTFLLFASCTDEIKFGNSFLEKAPGGTVTEDTIFNSAVYTRQFLTGIYSRQYFGLTVGTSDNYASSLSGWVGKQEALTDCWQLYYNDTQIYKQYYSGTLTSANSPIFDYTKEYVWQCVRWCYQLLENVDRVPDMDASEKARIKAEARCLIATRYFDMFVNYGGLPLVTHTYAATETSYQQPRATAEETVDFMISKLDSAIAEPNLPWAYEGDEADTETGHWTKAGAMALKCRILLFAASPLFNSGEGYYGGTSEAETQHLVWYGSYKAEYWQRLKTACEDFFNALRQYGHYSLVQSSGTRPQDYRLAFRQAYFLQSSPEVLHSVRVSNSINTAAECNWLYWIRVGRNTYCPTQEYVEMFPWSDGKPFNWEKDSLAGRLDSMFLYGDTASNKRGQLRNVTLTRDPRLYETCIVNGLNKSLDWTTANMSGDIYEMWVGGNDARQHSATESGIFATGYFIMKYALGTSDRTSANPDIAGHKLQWVTLRLSEMYLIYAEALLQTGDLQGAINLIDQVRARVGLKGLVESNPDENLTTDKDALLKELLRERACELGFENVRWMDIIRYKQDDALTKPLHGLLIHRLKLENGQWVNDDNVWTGAGSRRYPQPTHFSYQKFQINNRSRSWWTRFDRKWYLSPFNITEINKNYGLVQNPGW